MEIRRGRGTFVASPRIVQELSELTGFVEDMRVLGRIPTARVFSCEVMPAPLLVAGKLLSLWGQRWCGFSVCAFPTARRFLSTRPTCRRNSGANHGRRPRHGADLHLAGGTIRHPAGRGRICLGGRRTEPDVAAALEISVASPIFLIERTSYTLGHRAVDYERLHYRGDTIRFKTRLVRRRIPRAPKCD